MDFSPLKTCYHCGKLFETKNDDNDSDADFDEFNVNNFITMIVIVMIMKMRSKVVKRMLNDDGDNVDEDDTNYLND